MRCGFFRVKIELEDLIKNVVLKTKIVYVIDDIIDNIKINTVDNIDNIDFFDVAREVENKNVNNIDDKRR